MTRPTTTPSTRRAAPLTLLAVAVLTMALLQLAGCGQASGTDSGPQVEIVEKGPPISVDGPRYVLQHNGQDMSDGHGGRLEYRDPVVAGVILERLAMGDRMGLYTVEQRGGHWGVAYALGGPPSAGETPVLQPADVFVAQGGATGRAVEAPLEAGEATFQLATAGDVVGRTVEWYLDGALVAEGATAIIDLTPGEHLLSAVVWDADGGSQSVDIPLYVEPAMASATLHWEIPTERENGQALPVEELCCYQVTYLTGNTLSVLNVDGGGTTEVTLELEPGHYAFSLVAIDTNGLVSEPSDSVEATLSGRRSA